MAYFNGLGGFTQDGREYIISLRSGENTPAPWVNVMANATFGTVVSEGGSVFSWAENSHDFRLTPWCNDAVSGGLGEAIYIRDEETGRFWSPSPLPARGNGAYVIRHGFGYTVYEYAEDGIASEMTLYVSRETPVKFVRIRLANHSGLARRLCVTAYWELVLGESRSKTQMHVVTELDSATSAVFARNANHIEFGGHVVFMDTNGVGHTVTGDRTEFLGRNRSLADPNAMHRVRLSGHVGGGFDPCAAIQAPVHLSDGQEREIIFTLGFAKSEDEARRLLQDVRGEANAQSALEGVWKYWSHVLGVVNIQTPEPAINLLANGWLVYQTLSCRMWARAGFYQAGGAYGFRDQLQDAMALLCAAPELLREQLLRAAGRQFKEGDVQHWWHAHSGRGVRTHISDDFLWLPYAACRYVFGTGDTGVLDESIPYLDGRPVRSEEEAYYDLPEVTNEIGSLYEHCVRAVEHGLRFGEHGLPLMGGGDWNDGMNRVGEQGKGESVWLAFFLYDVLNRFGALARDRGDNPVADRFHDEAEQLCKRIEDTAWDGHWYLRGFFDNGDPLGSANSAECQIDSISQSWSVLSGAGDHTRAQAAMDSLDRKLVRRDAQLVQLLAPPFDATPLDPGYIKGYAPGVRENGGQYTHAAVWAAMAFAARGDTERAWELLSLINPINHAATPDGMRVYRAEPYVVAADVYSVPPHTGRGGWTWYTGSSGWMYRLIVECLLGLIVEPKRLRFAPHLPKAWTETVLHYRHYDTFYHITFHKSGISDAVERVTVDGADQAEKVVYLVDDHEPHSIEVYIV